MTDAPERGPQHSGPQLHGADNVGGERRPVRAYAPREKGRLRDVDTYGRALKLKAAGWAISGAILGAVLGVYGMGWRGWPAILLPVCVVGGWLIAFLVPLAFSSGAGKAAGTLYAPSGKSTPRAKEHSYAESLVARGRYEEAVDAFELAVQEDPADPGPYLRIARIYRDHLERFEDAARWFRRACREAALSPGQAILARREMVEVYVHRLGDPGKAAPELARMAEEMEGTPEGEWAAEELRHVKALMRGEAEA